MISKIKKHHDNPVSFPVSKHFIFLEDLIKDPTLQ